MTNRNRFIVLCFVYLCICNLLPTHASVKFFSFATFNFFLFGKGQLLIYPLQLRPKLIHPPTHQQNLTHHNDLLFLSTKGSCDNIIQLSSLSFQRACSFINKLDIL